MYEHLISLDDLEPSLASPDDATDIANLRSQLVDWLHARGIDQWHHGEVGRADIREQTTRNEWWIVRTSAGELIATARLLDQDTAIWGPSDSRAIYLHGLMVDRQYGGLQLGRQLLDWATAYGRTRNAELVRLDCVAANAALCDYYLRQGFHRVGTTDLPGNWTAAALFERAITDDGS